MRSSAQPSSFRLRRSLKIALTAFVALILFSAAHSLWIIHSLHVNQQVVDIAARSSQHFQRMVERAEHYQTIAPRDWPDFHRDVQLYYASLREDISMMDWMVSDLSTHAPAFDADLWNQFHNGLEAQIGDEPERPRLEWAAGFIADESAPLLAALESTRRELVSAADASRRQMWWSGSALAVVTFVLALVVVWLFRERVLKRIDQTAAAVRRMADGQFDGIRRKRADDELGQLEGDVAQMARRTQELIDLLDNLNGAESLHEAIERLPLRLRRQFSLVWMGLVEAHDGRMRLRLSYPAREIVGIEQPGVGWKLDGTLLARARESGKTVFETLRNNDGELGGMDPLLGQLRGSEMVSVALLPVMNNNRIEAGVLLASNHPDAFSGWRQRWLENVGHLIAHALYRSVHVEHLGISMVRGLAELAEKRDPTTGRHLERMQRFAGIIARELVARGRVDPRESVHFAEQVETFAPLHDIGKVGISDTILLKPGPLSHSEITEMRKHPKIGADVLMAAGKRLGAAGERMFAHAMDIALYHHEKFDGSGYPHGLVGDAIPLSARIVAVADVF
ncbi:MAG: HD domain-containing phosphohydrolase, partial [Wenzhouxiangellaceae bacterium]